MYCYGKQFKIVITPNPKLTNFDPQEKLSTLNSQLSNSLLFLQLQILVEHVDGESFGRGEQADDAALS